MVNCLYEQTIVATDQDPILFAGIQAALKQQPDCVAVVEEVIPYRYGTGCMNLRTENDTSMVVIHVVDDPVSYRGVLYQTVCAVHIAKKDSLHLIGWPLRMILQDMGFMVQLAWIANDEQLQKAMRESLSRLHEAVY